MTDVSPSMPLLPLGGDKINEHFTAGPDSIRKARDLIRSLALRWQLDALTRDKLFLMVAEALANALAHGGEVADLALHRRRMSRGYVLAVSVTDRANERLVIVSPATLLREGDGLTSGRPGLPTVHNLTAGTAQVWWNGPGNTVFFEVFYRPVQTAAQAGSGS